MGNTRAPQAVWAVEVRCLSPSVGNTKAGVRRILWLSAPPWFGTNAFRRHDRQAGVCDGAISDSDVGVSLARACWTLIILFLHF